MIEQPSPILMVSEPARSGSPATDVQALVREYRKRPRAVDGIDLAVWPGEIDGFLGPNGAGKSTTVLIFATLLALTSGHASVGGFDVRAARQIRETIGVALQKVALTLGLLAAGILVMEIWARRGLTAAGHAGTA